MITSAIIVYIPSVLKSDISIFTQQNDFRTLKLFVSFSHFLCQFCHLF